MFETARKYLKGDPILWGVIIGLSIFSLLAVYSATGTLAYRYQGGNTSYYIIKHATILFIGLLIIFVTHLVPHKVFSRLSQLFLIISIPLLIITLILGTSINQATRWLTIPGLGFTFQTSDFAKLALVMYVARLLSMKQDTIKEYHSAFLPVIIPVVIICGLIMPANLSTALMLFTACFILMFIGRINFRYMFLFSLAVIVIIAVVIFMTVKSDWGGRWQTWRHRIESFVDHENTDNFQVNQSKIAIVSGGLVKLRPGKSVQRNYLPHPYSDFIFAIIIEEYGLLGGILILSLYLYLLFRAGVIVRKSTRTFPAFLAMGLAILIVMQAMINMAVAVNLLPVTGQPLPMVSWGGTSMLFTCVALGIILSVSRGIDQPAEEIQTEEVDNEND